MEQKIKTWIENHKDEILNDLMELVRQEASTADIDELKNVRNKLKEIIHKRLDLNAEEIEIETKRNVLYTKVNESNHPILMIGHYDTVHPIHKLPIKIEDNIFYGPGVLDMKAGLIESIWACKAIQELGLHTHPIHLLFNGDEEIGSEGSKQVIIDKARNAKVALVLEPAVENGNLKTGRKGGTSCEIEIYGKASHAGNNPKDGINAIHEMAYHIIKLQALNDFEVGTTINVGKIIGGSATNVVPDYAKVTVDIRYKTLAEKERIKQAILDIPLELEGTRKEVKFSSGSDPMEQSPQNLKLFELASECANQLSLKIDHQFVGGASDGNRISFLGLPILDGLGAVGKGIHAIDEQINLNQYYERICLLILLLTKI